MPNGLTRTAVPAAASDAILIRCCNCPRRHRSYAAFAHCYWRDHAWIEGNGPYGTVSYCDSFGCRRGESSTTIMLWGTEAAARSALRSLHCGSRCTGDHDLVRLVLPS
jgi:hypothetical protein